MTTVTADGLPRGADRLFALTRALIPRNDALSARAGKDSRGQAVLSAEAQAPMAVLCVAREDLMFSVRVPAMRYRTLSGRSNATR